MLLFAFCFVPSLLAAPDIIHLRDGEVLEGRVIAEQRGTYLVQPGEWRASQVQVPKHAVKYILYSDPDRADQFLGLNRASQLVREAVPVTATVLPTEAFGEAIVDAVQDATESIRVAAYHVSGSEAGDIGEFYSALREKARAGLEVVILCEYGSGTMPALRHATLNFATELERDGIEVLFIQEHRTMHKKMIIVDGQTILLGSSNLTLAGTMHSNEMNVRIVSKPFVRAAIEDFRRMQERAVPASEVK